MQLLDLDVATAQLYITKQNVAKILVLEDVIDEIVSAMIATAMKMERIAILAAVGVGSVTVRVHGLNTSVARLTAVEVLIEEHARSTRAGLLAAR